VYAVIEDSGVQFRVSEGDTIEVDLRDLTEGQEQIEFDRVLMLGDGEAARIGTPYLEGASVIGRLHGLVKGQKLVVRKFKRRKDYRVKSGHRQKYLSVTIERISG
jgi:large subunit ribosomal protein L21